MYFIGEGTVTAEKMKTGDVWEFDSTFYETDNSHKLGAGNVMLTATAADGWAFSVWTSDVLDLVEDVASQEIKTAKYGDVQVIFTKVLHTIIPTVIGAGQITPSDTQYVTSGSNVLFKFIPDIDPEIENHISGVAIDGSFLSSLITEYEFKNVQESHTIDVYFSPVGEAIIPAGDAVTVFLGEGAGLTLDSSGGTAYGASAEFPDGSSAAVWDITISPNGFTGNVDVTVHYDEYDGMGDEELLRLIRGDSMHAIYSDVNGDLVVDGTDVSIVANAAKDKEAWYDPNCDIDNDGDVDEEDVHLVNQNKGTTLIDITDNVDTINNIIYGVTDHFSFFRCR